MTATDFDVSQQIGPDPVLPEPSPELLPDLKLAEVVGWQGRRRRRPCRKALPSPPMPRILSIRARSTPCPMAMCSSCSRAGPKASRSSGPRTISAAGSCRWPRRRRRAAEGKQPDHPAARHQPRRQGGRAQRPADEASIRPSASPGYDGTLYVAAADAILAYPYQLGQTEITAAPTVLTPLPGGPINHHWTKDLALSPDGRYLYASVGSNSNAAERGLEAEKGRAAIWQVDRQTGAARVFASGLRNPNGLTFHPKPASCGRWSMSATNSARIWCPTT